MNAIELIGENHIGTSLETPLRANASEINEDKKIQLIEIHFKEIMHILELELNDDCLVLT